MVRWAGTLAAAALTVASATVAVAQVKTGAEQGLGLTGGDVPPLLKLVQADPYRAPAEPACESIPREILALDQVLGPDVDEAARPRSKVREMAGGAVRGMIPYRGWVRFLTQAGEKDKKLQRAASAGYARRGFLRGLEANLRCAEQVPRAVPANAIVADRTTGGDEIAARMVADRGLAPEDAPPPSTADLPSRDDPALAAPRIEVPPQPGLETLSEPRR